MPLSEVDSRNLEILTNEAARLASTVDDLLSMIEGGQGGEAAAGIAAHNNDAAAHAVLLANTITQAVTQSQTAVAVDGAQDFNAYTTPGLWTFNPAEHINGPAGAIYSGALTAGGLLSVTTDRKNPVTRVFQEYKIWQEATSKQSLVFTRGQNAYSGAWGPWICNSAAMDGARAVSHAIPTMAAPLIMPYDGWVITALSTSTDVTRSALVVDGFEVAMYSASLQMIVKTISPIIRKGSSVWTSGSSLFLWTVPTIGA